MRAGKKVPPKCNTGLLRAFYAPQFMALLVIRACCGSGLSSVQGLSDGGGVWGYALLVRGTARLFPEKKFPYFLRKKSSGFFERKFPERTKKSVLPYFAGLPQKIRKCDKKTRFFPIFFENFFTHQIFFMNFLKKILLQHGAGPATMTES